MVVAGDLSIVRAPGKLERNAFRSVSSRKTYGCLAAPELLGEIAAQG